MGVLDGKVAIVTGGSKGVGRGEAFALAKEGAKVAIVARGQAALDATSEEIAGFGGTALPIVCDVCSVDDVNRAVQTVVDAWGRVDILVNNAQIMFPPRPLEEWTEDEMRTVWESGLLGSWAFMVACLPHMKAAGGGRIINTCSCTGHGVFTGRVGYAATKEAIRSLTRTGAREWGQHKITVNSISPMAITDTVMTIHPDPEAQLALLKDGPSVLKHRWADPEADVGRAVVFLAGPDAELITGVTLGVDLGSAML